jgi:hypothetical protein
MLNYQKGNIDPQCANHSGRWAHSAGAAGAAGAPVLPPGVEDMPRHGSGLKLCPGCRFQKYHPEAKLLWKKRGVVKRGDGRPPPNPKLKSLCSNPKARLAIFSHSVSPHRGDVLVQDCFGRWPFGLPAALGLLGPRCGCIFLSNERCLDLHGLAWSREFDHCFCFGCEFSFSPFCQRSFHITPPNVAMENSPTCERFTHGFPMVYPWFSHGFPGGKPWHPRPEPSAPSRWEQRGGGDRGGSVVPRSREDGKVPAKNGGFNEKIPWNLSINGGL